MTSNGTQSPSPQQGAPAAALPRLGSWHDIWRLAWPQMLMMLVHFFIGFVDVLVAGRIGKEVQASFGLITQCMLFLLILAMAVANGGVAAVSQSLGAGRARRARRYAGLLLCLSLGGGLVIMLLGLLFQERLLLLLRVPEQIRPLAEYFLAVYLITLPPYYLLLVSNAVLRAYKLVQLPLYAMILVTAVNTVLDFGLGLGLWGFPNLGYKGVAWATFFSISAGALCNLVLLRRRGLLGAEAWPGLRWARKARGYLFKVAWPAGAMQVVWQTGYLVLFAIVAALPMERVAALAGMTAGLRVEAILFLPAFAFNMTASILVGHCIGAGRPDEAKRLAYQILGIGVGSITLLALTLWQFVEPVSHLLSTEPLVRAQMRGYLLYNVLAIPFTVCTMILSGVMVGAGATLYNLMVFGACTWLVRLPLAYYLGHIHWRESSGVWVAMLVSQALQAAVMWYLFHFKEWGRFGLRASAPDKRKGAYGP